MVTLAQQERVTFSARLHVCFVLVVRATDLNEQCGVKWVSRFTTKTNDVLDSPGTEMDKKTTLTSMALRLAWEELKWFSTPAAMVS